MIHYDCCRTSSGGKVIVLEIKSTFVVSVMASVISYFICKWLEGDE